MVRAVRGLLVSTEEDDLLGRRMDSEAANSRVRGKSEHLWLHQTGMSSTVQQNKTNGYVGKETVR